MRALYRLLDANQNRATEALRVLEDHCRFILNDESLCAALKDVRHSLREALSTIDGAKLIAERDSESDVGRPGSQARPAAERPDLAAVLAANSSRAREALRSLEEFCRPIQLQAAEGLERLRYKFYEIERRLLHPRRELQNSLRAQPLCLLVTPSPQRPELRDMFRAGYEGGCRFFQLRIKSGSDREHYEQAEEAARFCRDHDCLLVINDRSDIAAGLDSVGVHLGQDDLPPKQARKILGQSAIIGCSVHNKDEMTGSLSEDLDYLGIGTIFASPTKAELGSAGPDLLRELAPMTRLAIFAIGGITAANAAQAIEAGATGVAVSSAILDAADIAAETRAIISEVQDRKRQMAENTPSSGES